ncbi:hypothetical protein [Streptomyces sp. G-G2]|uniref:hypothetical protein n=1 Tax=Streptomyces sp. G-G2 TaxID=3046201 RepID=UPI0024B8F6DD|nr:hypothetical protein [Streptomyces sp. G-G2]MDJ0381426.1 hypothetical protein [Streptomyces sp. G-G2]
MTTNENALPNVPKAPTAPGLLPLTDDGELKPLDNHASGTETKPLDNHASGEELQTMDNHASGPRP